MFEADPLPPELWNLSVVIVVCGLLGWAIRLVRLLLIYLEARFSIQQDAVLHLEKLGPSLHVLRHAPMWHFHQLLRTQLQVASTAMKRVQVPFEVVTSSLRLVKSLDAHQQPQTDLFVEVKSARKCMVQVFWGAKTEALEGACQTAASESIQQSRKQARQWVHAVLPTRAAQNAIHAVRSLPEKFYDVGFVNTPHRLLEEDTGKDTDGVREATWTSPKKLGPARLFEGQDAFRSYSVMRRSENSSADEFVATLPNELLASPHVREEIQSSIVATDCGDDQPSASDPVSPSAEDLRYACVIAIGASDFFESAAGPNFPSLGMRKRRRATSSPSENREDEIICQCVAINFLPTPASPSGAPVVVKKLNLTSTDVYSCQEIFGTGGECVICLERALAAVLLPCRHLCVCRACLEEIDQCPICRANFSTYASFESSSESPSAAASHLNLNM